MNILNLKDKSHSLEFFMLQNLAELKENDFSKKILVPLFEKIYGCRVAFTGGGCEKGRDIIIYYKDPLGHDEFIGVQVKKLHATPNSSSNSFQQLLSIADTYRKLGREGGLLLGARRESYRSNRIGINEVDFEIEGLR